MSPQFAVVFLFLVGLIHAQVQYEIVQLQGTNCVPVVEYQCVQCGNYYYSGYIESGGYGYYAMYTNSQCTNFYSGYYSMYHGGCIENSMNCSMFVQAESYSYYTASFSTTSNSIKVGSWPNEGEFLALNLGATTVQATGLLDYVQFKTPNTKFIFESLVTTTKYSTNLGVFDFGTMYTEGDLSFTIERQANQSGYTFTQPDFGVVFAPFTNVHVTNTAEYEVVFLNSGEILVATDSSYNLDGLVIGLFNYSDIHSMTLYPPVYADSDAQLVFEMPGSEGYWTYPCDEGSSQIVYCEFSSTLIIILGGSGSIPPIGSFGSFSFSLSLDEQPSIRPNDVDDMAFSLF